MKGSVLLTQLFLESAKHANQDFYKKSNNKQQKNLRTVFTSFVPDNYQQVRISERRCCDKVANLLFVQACVLLMQWCAFVRQQDVHAKVFYPNISLAMRQHAEHAEHASTLPSCHSVSMQVQAFKHKV